MSFLKKIAHFSSAWIAYWFYGRSSRKLIVVGVTGTKGKSTTCRLIASVLEAGGYKVGLLSTVEFQIADKRWPNDKKMTMLGRGQIQRLLKQMVKAGCKYAVVETSSEGILQYRHIGLNYQIAVFTNLGAEHLERHGSFENLKKDKGKMFAKAKIIIANADDEHAKYFLSFFAPEKHTFGLNPQNQPDIFGKDVVFSRNGIDFIVGKTKFTIHLLGKFNVYNALAAIAVGKSQKIPEEKIADGLASVKLVAGRMEEISIGQDFKVIVDYAHEPMSLTELFTTLREVVGGNSGSREAAAVQSWARKIIAVIGSDGGGRDKGKRKTMGEIAGRLADSVVVTDVNCYDEDPKEIAEMLAAGARLSGKKDGDDLFVIIDRREAIAKAVSLAQTGDIVVITAKGTEPYIAVAGGKKIPWDDRKVAREVLENI